MSIPMIDLDEFRRRVAGLADPSMPANDGDKADLRHMATLLCVSLCELFSDSLDRLTLWDRIGSALTTAAAKTQDADLEHFASLCLEHVKADPGAVARHAEFGGWLHTVNARPDAWRRQFIQHVRSKTPIVLVHARSAWEDRKDVKKKAK